MECPVCQHTHVAEDATHCPECGSELEGFRYIKQSKSERRVRKRYLFSLAAVILLLLSGWVVSTSVPGKTGGGEASASMMNDSNPSAPTEMETKILQLEATVAQQEKKIERLEAELQDYQALDMEVEGEEENYTIHVVQDGESLWSISEMYHGHGHEHGNIADHNEVNNPHHIKPGDTVIIKH